MGDKARGQRRLEFAVHLLVGLAVVVAALGVADDHVRAAGVNQHGRRIRRQCARLPCPSGRLARTPQPSIPSQRAPRPPRP